MLQGVITITITFTSTINITITITITIAITGLSIVFKTYCLGRSAGPGSSVFEFRSYYKTFGCMLLRFVFKTLNFM